MAQADATGPHTEGRLVGPIGEVEEGGQLASEGGAPAAMKPVDWQQYRTWLADKEAEIERCHHSPDWRLLRFEWHSVTRDLADTIQRLERMNSESPEAFHGQPFQGTLAHLNHLQRQIDALIETICAPEDRGSPESDTQA